MYTVKRKINVGLQIGTPSKKFCNKVVQCEASNASYNRSNKQHHMHYNNLIINHLSTKENVLNVAEGYWIDCLRNEVSSVFEKYDMDRN